MGRIWTLALMYSKEYRINLFGALALTILLPIFLASLMSNVMDTSTPEAAERLVIGSLLLPALSIGVATLAAILVRVRMTDADWLVSLPISPVAWTLGFTLPQIVLASSSSLIVAGVLRGIFGIDIQLSWMLVPYMILLSYSVIWIGAVIARLSGQNEALAGALAQLIVFGLLLGTPIYYSPDNLHPFVAALSAFLPTTIAADGLSSVLAGLGHFEYFGLLYLGGYALISLVVVRVFLPWSKL